MENVKKEDISSLAKNAVKKLSSSRRKITASEVVLSCLSPFDFCPPLPFCFSGHVFSLAGHLLGLLLVRRVLAKVTVYEDLTITWNER